MGADGYIPSMAPLYPNHYQLYEAGKKGDIEKTKFYMKIVNMTSAIWPMAASRLRHKIRFK